MNEFVPDRELHSPVRSADELEPLWVDQKINDVKDDIAFLSLWARAEPDNVKASDDLYNAEVRLTQLERRQEQLARRALTRPKAQP